MSEKIVQHVLKPIKLAHPPTFKPAFIERYSKLTDFEIFKKYSLSYLNRSFRVNTIKISTKELVARLEAQGWMLQPVPWCSDAFWAEHKTGRRDLGNTLEHQLGYMYIQEAASMIPPVALDAQPGDIVFDMCAAPGSKTTQIAQQMNNQGVVVANDIVGIRLAPLGSNLQRLGITNVVQTQSDAAKIKGMPQFDKILLDAPCSGIGTIRKSLKTITMWNPGMTRKMSNMQKKLIVSAWALLKPGGFLVYSTCSTEPEEDEEVISDFLQKNSDAEIVDINLPNFKKSPAVLSFEGKEYDSRVAHTLRVWPQDNNTEGFYIAKLRKSL